MYAQGNVYTLWKAIMENSHAGSLILQEITASLVVLIELASYGMQAVGNALRHSEVIMMKSQMLVLTQLVIVLLQQALMVLQESIMCSLAHVFHYCRVIKMKSLKYRSIHRETKSLQLVAIRHAEYGQQTLAMKFKCQKVMKMKYFHVHSIMKETLSSQDQKITHVEFGKTQK